MMFALSDANNLAGMKYHNERETKKPHYVSYSLKILSCDRCMMDMWDESGFISGGSVV